MIQEHTSNDNTPKTAILLSYKVELGKHFFPLKGKTGVFNVVLFNGKKKKKDKCQIHLFCMSWELVNGRFLMSVLKSEHVIDKFISPYRPFLSGWKKKVSQNLHLCEQDLSDKLVMNCFVAH